MKKGTSLSFVLLSAVLAITRATQATEREDQALEIKLYPMSKSDWTSAKETAFKTVIFGGANTYCSNSPSSCNLDSAATFTISEVGVVTTTDNSKSMKLTFYVDLPSGASVSAGSSLAYVLSKDALEAITEDARDTIKSDTDAYVTYVGETYFGIPPDSTANAIIIPIAVVIVLIVAVVTVCLAKWQTKKERAERIQQRQLKNTYGATHSASSDPPTYSMSDATNTTFISAGQPTPRHGNKVVPDEETDRRTIAAYNLAPLRGPKVTEFREDDDEMLGLQNGRTVLIPMHQTKTSDVERQLEEDEAERLEKRRRKKERRRERRRQKEQMESYDNQGLDTSGGLTDTDPPSNNVPTFTVQSGSIVA